MPYLGRTPAGAAGNKITGDLKVTGVLSADSISNNIVLDGTDGGASNENDNVVMNGTDTDYTNANDNLLYEENTGDMLVEKRIPTSFGTSGQSIQSAGNATAPTFAAGPHWTLLETVTVATPQDNVTFILDNALYSDYQFLIADLIPSTDRTQFTMRYSTDGGENYLSSDYSWAGQTVIAGIGMDNHNSNSDAHIELTGRSETGSDRDLLGNAGGEFASFEGKIHEPGSDVRTITTWQGAYEGDRGNFVTCYGGGYSQNSEETDAIEFRISSGNIASGVFKLLGLSK